MIHGKGRPGIAYISLCIGRATVLPVIQKSAHPTQRLRINTPICVPAPCSFEVKLSIFAKLSRNNQLLNAQKSVPVLCEITPLASSHCISQVGAACNGAVCNRGPLKDCRSHCLLSAGIYEFPLSYSRRYTMLT